MCSGSRRIWKSAHSRRHPVVRQDKFEVAIRHGSGAWSARNGHRDGTVFSKWLERSQQERLRRRRPRRRKFEDEKQKEEDSVASFPAALNNAVNHAGSSNESADICRTNTLMKTMNR